MKIKKALIEPGDEVVVRERTLNLLKLTGISAPYYIARRIYWDLFPSKKPTAREHRGSGYSRSFREMEALPKDHARYAELVAKGIEKMKGSRVVLCGCVRDEERLIATTLDRLEKTGRMFGDYRIVIFESDSADGTLRVLRKRADTNKKIAVLTEKTRANRYADHSKSRMETMAYCRNKCLDFAQKSFPDFDYMMVVDLDARGGWSNQGVANSFGHDGWDAIGANGLDDGKYYDSLPLRIDGFEDRAYTGGRQERYDERQVKKNQVEWKADKRPNLRTGEPLVPVFSCFAGMAIYRMAALQGSRYGSEDCEHVSLHKKMHANGFARFYMNPSMLFIVR
jgi:hypothetical protein